MEVESEFLSHPSSRPKIQTVLEDILVSLNSKQRDCHLLLDDANLLNLQLFKPPPPPTPPVPDYAVPILLRPEWQLQMYDWDLTINWIVPNIDGVKNVGQIAQSSEVDMEMVRACLRVLRHHGVLAHVDVFRYSNVYECTPLAMELFSAETAGWMGNTNEQEEKEETKKDTKEEKELLDSAFRYAAKAKYVRRAQNARGRFNSSNSDASLNYYLSSTPTRQSNHHSSIHGLDLSLHSATPAWAAAVAAESSSKGRSLENDMYALSRSFPSRTTSHLAIAEECATDADALSRITPPTGSKGGTTDRLDLSTSLQNEICSMKMALARLYCSCTRNVTFGDVLLAKMAEEANADDAGPSNTGTATGDANENSSASNVVIDSMLSPLREGSESDAGVSTSDQGPRQKDGNEESGGKNENSAKDKRGEIDWKKAFDYFDHRRMITFGVLHGLIQRVHQYPLAYEVEPGVGDDNPNILSTGMESVTTDGGDDGVDDFSNMGFTSDHFDPDNNNSNNNNSMTMTQDLEPETTSSLPTNMDGNMSTGLSPSLSLSPSIFPRGVGGGGGGVVPPPPPFLEEERIINQLSQHKQTLKAKKLLIERIASAMDGTRCEDELSCMFEMPLEELVDMVRGAGRWDVISVFSSME